MKVLPVVKNRHTRHRLGGVPTTPDPNTSAKVSHDTNGSRIVMQIGGVYTTFCQEEGILLQKYAIEMGAVSRCFSEVSRSGVDLTLLIDRKTATVTESFVVSKEEQHQSVHHNNKFPQKYYAAMSTAIITKTNSPKQKRHVAVLSPTVIFRCLGRFRTCRGPFGNVPCRCCASGRPRTKEKDQP